MSKRKYLLLIFSFLMSGCLDPWIMSALPKDVSFETIAPSVESRDVHVSVDSVSRVLSPKDSKDFSDSRDFQDQMLYQDSYNNWEDYKPLPIIVKIDHTQSTIIKGKFPEGIPFELEIPAFAFEEDATIEINTAVLSDDLDFCVQFLVTPIEILTFNNSGIEVQPNKFVIFRSKFTDEKTVIDSLRLLHFDGEKYEFIPSIETNQNNWTTAELKGFSIWVWVIESALKDLTWIKVLKTEIMSPLEKGKTSTIKMTFLVGLFAFESIEVTSDLLNLHFEWIPPVFNFPGAVTHSFDVTPSTVGRGDIAVNIINALDPQGTIVKNLFPWQQTIIVDKSAVSGMEEIAKKHKPILYLSSGESLYPIKLEDTFNALEATVEGIKIVLYGPPDAFPLIDQAIHLTSENFKDVLGKMGAKSYNISPYHSSMPESWMEKKFESAIIEYQPISAIYWTATACDSDGYALQYWFYYHTDTKEITDHPGDWESVTVLLDKDKKPYGVALAQHNGKEFVPWNEIIDPNNGHPVIYVAKDSHASYAVPVEDYKLPLWLCDSTGYLLDECTDTADGKGEIIDSGELIELPRLLKVDSNSSFSWLLYSGTFYWQLLPIIDNLIENIIGPRMPPFNGPPDKWLDPCAWAGVSPPTCEENCDGKECGYDECGNLCSSCPIGEKCNSGICVKDCDLAINVPPKIECCGKDACAYNGCDNSLIGIFDYCEGNSYCLNGVCIDDNYCGDGKCNNSETYCNCSSDCQIKCGDGCCSAGESYCNCSSDCSKKCSDGCCSTGEDKCNCESDCGKHCGDGSCNCGETNSTCCQDCGGCISCGNKKCEAGENSCNCKSDCAGCCDDLDCPVCSGICKEAICFEENCECIAAKDCCGNKQCEPEVGENYKNCPEDCDCVPNCSNKQCGDDGCGKKCGECANGYICNENNTCQWDIYCGNTICDSGETYCNCSLDCSIKCGDGCCSLGEDKCNCESDCGKHCGDGSCNCGEACISCSQDCGSCAFCGDEECNSSETSTNCCKDCGCPSGKICQNNQCVCVSSCSGKQCGDDGCGGNCGSCGAGHECENYKCISIYNPCATLKCYDNDVYCYDSSGQKKDKNQECGEISVSTGSSYCNNGDVVLDVTKTEKGCNNAQCYEKKIVTTEPVEYCDCGCSNGDCKSCEDTDEGENKLITTENKKEYTLSCGSNNSKSSACNLEQGEICSDIECQCLACICALCLNCCISECDFKTLEISGQICESGGDKDWYKVGKVEECLAGNMHPWVDISGSSCLTVCLVYDGPSTSINKSCSGDLKIVSGLPACCDSGYVDFSGTGDGVDDSGTFYLYVYSDCGFSGCDQYTLTFNF